MAPFDPFDLAYWLQVGAAVFCGGLVGLERQLRGKPAGIRTSALVCLGTAMFVRLGAGAVTESADPTRVIGQVVTGIGFLGAGVIMTRGGLVTGVTSAAVIWVLAAIGAAVGLGHLTGAVALTFVTVGILVGVETLEVTFRRLRQGVHSHPDDEPHASNPAERSGSELGLGGLGLRGPGPP
jgi:putative Mg2+ transporter-C (MgtC) family protein